MSCNNSYMHLRVKAVQEFDQMYYEPEYKAKCHKRVWKRLGRYIFGISYQSYLDYLKMDVSDIPPTPFEARQAQLKLVDKLLERELERMKHPVRREKPEEWKKEPVEQGRRQLFQRRDGLSGPSRFFGPQRFSLPDFRLPPPRPAFQSSCPIPLLCAPPRTPSPARRNRWTNPRSAARPT